jgi:Domain of unknown function (DUF4411)
MISGIILACDGKAYCLDTSGLSNPLETMPEDIHATLWFRIAQIIEAGKFAVTKEIYDELVHLPGPVGVCIQKNCPALQLEIGDDEWDWESYIAHVNRMRVKHKSIISEYNGNRKGTVGLNDVSIVALAKSLGLPVISMEATSFQFSATKVRIPGLCTLEEVEHLTFNKFLRAEWISN